MGRAGTAFEHRLKVGLGNRTLSKKNESYVPGYNAQTFPTTLAFEMMYRFDNTTNGRR